MTRDHRPSESVRNLFQYRICELSDRDSKLPAVCSLEQMRFEHSVSQTNKALSKYGLRIRKLGK